MDLDIDNTKSFIIPIYQKRTADDITGYTSAGIGLFSILEKSGECDGAMILIGIISRTKRMKGMEMRK